MSTKAKSILKDPDVAKTIYHSFQYVVVPADKVTYNIILSQKYYFDCFINELDIERTYGNATCTATKIFK